MLSYWAPRSWYSGYAGRPYRIPLFWCERASTTDDVFFAANCPNICLPKELRLYDTRLSAINGLIECSVRFMSQSLTRTSVYLSLLWRVLRYRSLLFSFFAGGTNTARSVYKEWTGIDLLQRGYDGLDDDVFALSCKPPTVLDELFVIDTTVILSSTTLR